MTGSGWWCFWRLHLFCCSICSSGKLCFPGQCWYCFFSFFEAFICIFLTSACEAVLEGSEKSTFLSSQRLHGSRPGVLPTLVVQTHLSEKSQATQQFRKMCFCCCRSIVSKIRKINTMNLKKINLEDVWLGVLSLFNAVCLGRGRWISRFQEDYI